MNDHLIREVVAGDAAQIVDIHSRSVRELSSGDYSTKQIDAWIGKRVSAEMALFLTG
jgi:hypothetical protein